MAAEGTTSRSIRRRLLGCLTTATAAALFAGALPAVASATDYCVDTSCGGQSAASFEEAIAKAQTATDADRIFLGARTYATPTGFYYWGPNSPVEIVGQGVGQTVLTRSAPDDDVVLRLIAGAGSSVHDLTIRLPKNTQAGAGGLATKNAARRIEVIDEDPTEVLDRTGVYLYDGGTLDDSSVTLGNTSTTAVVLATPDVALRGSTVSALTSVKSYGGTIERSRLIGTDAGVAAQRGVTTLDSSVVRLTEGNGVGIYASAASGFHTTLNADGVTIVGPDLPNTDAADVFNAFAPTEGVDLNLTNSIIRGFEHPLWAASAGPGQAKIDISYSDYDPSGNVTSGGPTAVIADANVTNVGDAGFVNAAGGDYRLLPGSPLIDSGDPATPQGLDLDGGPLVADGNGDGVARRDPGAFELQPGTAGGGIAGGGQQGNTPGGDTVAPLVSRFRATPALFAVARAGTPLAARVGRGTRFRFTLSEPARVTVKIQRALPGRRASGRCVRPRPQLSKAPRCVRYRTAGALARSARRGANTIRFSGRLGKRALRPGAHQAVVTATDAAGNRSALRTARFRVARG
jgi:hypothetical protein